MSTASNEILFDEEAYEFDNSVSNIIFDSQTFCEQLESLENLEEEEESEKEPVDTFQTSLWDDYECPTVRTADSWDVPLRPVAWDENDKPIEKLLSYADLTLTVEEENGLLTDRIVAACSSYLTESPGNKCHAVVKVSLSNKNLNDIRILGYHRFLQYVDLSWNNLTDITPLGCLPYLMYLDVSHNLLEEVLRFRPPLSLTYVNYSYNEVWQIDDLTDFWSLSYLDLSHNKISKIQGLHCSRYLRHLDLSHNKIERFENLNYLRITDLNLEYNLISKFETQQGLGMRTLSHLTNVYLNNNLITSLEFLEGVCTLKKLELQNNNISDPVQLNNLKFLKHLRHIDLSGNPVSELKPYRNLILNFLQNLKFLDQTEVDMSERVAACKNQKFDVQLEAARNNARMILLEQLNDTSLDLDVLPVDQGPYPFVILVGPSGSAKKEIVSQLREKYPEKIRIGKLHTTRNITEAEEKLFIHLEKEDFNESIKSGKFLCVSENLGDLYGFSREELAKSVKEQKLCLTALDMVSALTIHSYGIQPFLVLAIPQNREEHIKRLKRIYGPVLSFLGGTYIGHRVNVEAQLTTSKAVKVVLDELISGVFERLSSSAGRRNSDHAFEDFQSGASVEGNRHDSDLEDPPGQCYMTDTGCFTCTASKCGYQTSRLQNETKCSVCETEDTKRSANPESDSSFLNAETSYSTTPKKYERLSDLIVYGEDNPFVNWDMPFIDWSEVNLTPEQLQEAGELLCEKYIENVMSSTDVYQNLHLDNPGLFSLSVATDDIEKAVKDITKFLKDVWRTTPKRSPIFDVENDLVYKEFVPRKLEKLKEMLHHDFMSADGDGTFKGINTRAPINSPASIVSEMHMKGYGDFVEKL